MPAKPVATPTIETRFGRSPVTVRSSTIQSGTDAISSEARPIGTSRSATNSIAFAPSRSTPTNIAARSSFLPTRKGARPWRSVTQPAISTPARRNRTPAANTGGIVSPASSIPRYVEPQMM